MRSGSAHCDLQLATMKHEEYEEEEEEEEAEEEEEDEETRARVTLIKSSNPHLAGGEQTSWQMLAAQFTPFASFCTNIAMESSETVRIIPCSVTDSFTKHC